MGITYFEFLHLAMPEVLERGFIAGEIRDFAPGATLTSRTSPAYFGSPNPTSGPTRGAPVIGLCAGETIREIIYNMRECGVVRNIPRPRTIYPAWGINITACVKLMSPQMNGVEEKKMRYAELPGIFEDSAQVESDWYTLAV
jgi:hypothetical protein